MEQREERRQVTLVGAGGEEPCGSENYAVDTAERAERNEDWNQPAERAENLVAERLRRGGNENVTLDWSNWVAQLTTATARLDFISSPGITAK